MIRTILVATDGSDHSGRAIDVASELAGALDASITLVNVVAHSALVPVTMGIHAEVEHVYESNRTILQHAGSELLARGEKRAHDAGVSQVDTRMVFGSPGREIVAMADEIGADMIVMGRRGLGDLAGLLLGSVSHTVSHLAKQTVVTVM